jgi:glycosyltransferase involved in cell wall biosynthesis
MESLDIELACKRRTAVQHNTTTSATLPRTRVSPSTPRYSFSVTLVSFAFNEEELIQDFAVRMEAFLGSLAADFEWLVVNDGSTDRTGALLDEFARTRPWVRVFHNDRNRGTAWSVKRVIPHATKDVFFWQTVDESYDLTNLVAAMGEIARYDILQGVRGPAWSWRTLTRARSDSFMKAVISTANYLLVRVLFQLPLQDYQNITIYRRQLVQSLELESNSAFTSPEMLLKSWWKGARILEVPTPFRPRTTGSGKGTKSRFVLAAVRDIFHWWWRWSVLHRDPTRQKGSVARWNGGQIISSSQGGSRPLSSAARPSRSDSWK